MMTCSQANEMAAKFRLIDGFSQIGLGHEGYIEEMTAAVEAEKKWSVELWSVNARAGNRNLHIVRDYTTDDKEIKLIARIAKNNATQRDQAAYARMAGERAANAT